MKKVLSLFSALLVFGLVNSYAQQGTVTFAKTEHDFGKIEMGKPVTFEFSFKNTGKAPVVLGAVTASCGCTTPVWTKEPIAPNGTGTVKATFNAGTIGPFNKTVTVPSNGENGTVYLTLKGEVLDKKDGAAAKPSGN